MLLRQIKHLLLFMLVPAYLFPATFAFPEDHVSLVEVTPNIREYALSTVKPILDSYAENDRLSLLLKVSDILIDPELGVHKNFIEPSKYILYDKFEKLKLGFLITFNLSAEQKNILISWHSKFMNKNPADVFFGPSADDIIKAKAAFGCSHYARSFMAVVKALGLMDNPGDLRYAISSKADDYNQALDNNDREMTINGHQFVLVRIGSKMAGHKHVKK